MKCLNKDLEYWDWALGSKSAEEKSQIHISLTLLKLLKSFRRMLAHQDVPNWRELLIWRVRVNDYRIVYQIKDDQLLILIIRIGHRKDIYEGL
jgi:addiction module RelE/StbE family toxin